MGGRIKERLQIIDNKLLIEKSKGIRMNKTKRAISICLLMFITQVCFSQSGSVNSTQETGLWNGLYLKVKLSKKLGYYSEHHLRLRNSEHNPNDFAGRKNKIYNRFGLNIFFNKYFEAVIGPVLVLNYTPSPGNSEYEKIAPEPRIWHQWLFKMPAFGRVKFYHQLRFEHRWKRSNIVGSEYNYTNRYRYKFFAYIPINKKKIEEKTLYFSPSAEIFMHSGKSVVFNPFEDFRTYNGFGYVLNHHITFFAGYMWTYGQAKTGYEYEQSHVIRLNIFVGLDARSPEKQLPSINIGY